MKQWIWKHLWFLIAITCAIGGAICFAIIGNWHALAWALLAGSGDGLYLRERIYLERVEKEYREYIIKVGGLKW